MTSSPCFVSVTPLPSVARPASRSPSVCTRPQVAQVRMSAGANADKKESLTDWLLGKLMHNLDDSIGYEPMLKVAEIAREDEQKKMYDDKSNGDTQ